MPDNIATSIAAPPPAAAPAAPPSAPPPSAPPAAPPPATPIAVAPSTTAPTPVSDGTAAPSGPQPPTAPNPKEFGNATDWYMADTAYKAELEKFKAEHPEVAIPEPKPEEVKAPETTTDPEIKTEETPKEETKPEDTEHLALEDEPDMTPQAFNDLLKAKPEREAYLATDPELKNTMMRMARENSSAKEMLQLYPTAESAKFAKETAQRTVSLRAQFEQADTPEAMTSAFDNFAQEFAVTGPDGKQVMGEDGQPVFADDFYGMLEHVVRDRYIQGNVEEIQARLDANQYRTPEEKTADEDRLIANQILMSDFSGDNPKDPDLSTVPENLRADMQKRLDDVKRREAELDAKSGKASKDAQKSERAKYQSEFFAETGKRVGTQINQTIDKMRAAGVSIPEWMLKTTIPGTDTPVFYDQVGKEVDKLFSADPYTQSHFKWLEARATTPEGLKEWLEYGDSVVNRTDSRGVKNITAIIKKIVRGFGTQVAAEAAARPEPTTTASREPRGGGPVTPKTMTRDDAYHEATRQLSKEVPGWNDLQQNEQMALAMTRQMQLMTAKR